LDAQGVPSTDGIIQALRVLGPTPINQLTLLSVNVDWSQTGADGKTLLKKRLLQVGKAQVVDGRNCLVLK
jgi:hypothetical protein